MKNSAIGKLYNFIKPNKKTKTNDNSLKKLKATDENIKIGIIGAGRMGITHYSIINGLENVSVVAIADNSKPMLSMFSKYMNVKTFADWKDLLDVIDLDAVLICTPPSVNKDILSKCSSKRIHVFIEKPFLINSNEAYSQSAEFLRLGLVNQVGYVNRLNAIFMKVKDLLNKKIIGDVIRFKNDMYSSTIIESHTGSGWRSNKNSGGGVSFEMATHAIDLSIYFFGIPESVNGTIYSKVFSSDVDDIVSSNFIYKNGIAGSLFVNWSDKSKRKPLNVMEIIGSNGKIIADQYELKIYMNNENPQESLISGWNLFSITDLFYNVPFYVRGNEFSKQLVDFVEQIRNSKNKSCASSFYEAAETLSLLEKMDHDAKRPQTMEN